MIEKLFKTKRLILTCGSGGVGKTTLAAALALKGAMIGKKVVVCTIDPARRLATSLGLDSLSGNPTPVDVGGAPKGPPSGASFDAMMLDTKRTFDFLVERYAPSKEAATKILSNKIYQHLSSMIAGSQEYMAMEKIYEFATDSDYDLIVIDTPPTIHAFDFLEAPQKMIDALGHSLLHFLLKPALLAGKSGLKLFDAGTKIALKVFDRVTGFAFLQDISEMLISFQDLLGGFEGRAKEVQKILTDKATAFLLVSSCDDKSVDEAALFIEKLTGSGLPFSGLIVNRVHPLTNFPGSERGELDSELSRLVGTEMAGKMWDCLDRQQALAVRDRDTVGRLRKLARRESFVLTIPQFESDIHDLEALKKIVSILDASESDNS